MTTKEQYALAYSYAGHHWIHTSLHVSWKYPNFDRAIIDKAVKSRRLHDSYVGMDHLGNYYRQCVRFHNHPIIGDSSKQHTRAYIALLKTRRANRTK